MLVVEDEMLLALDTCDMLVAAGFEPIGPATSLQDAMALADAQSVDAALLDIRLNGDLVWPVALQLQAMQVPFIFITAFGTTLEFPSELIDAPVLVKPVTNDIVLEALREILP